jgi:predicted RNA-binding protein with TRAM domain
MPSPVKEGEVYHVKIVDVGRQGDGIARLSGLIIFVPGAKVGEEMDVKIVKVARSSAFAEKIVKSEEGSVAGADTPPSE